MIMSRAIYLVLAVNMLVVFSAADISKYFHMEGSAGEDAKGTLRLTYTKRHTYGQAFHQEPIRFKNSTNGTVVSFAVTIFFAIVPEFKHRGAHGMAFVLSPTKGIPGASPDQYLGIFNNTNNGNTSNHIIAVELDIHKDDEFHDINDNHVGININGLTSVKSAPAGYYDQDGNFRNLSLISGKVLRLSIVYGQQEKQLNVTLCPADIEVPTQPLLSLNQGLSPHMLEDMYAGFTASTGSTRAIHYMWLWYIYLDTVFNPVLEFSRLPVFPPFPKNT